jgi:diguanylate cyclase (GGDEF)-like protein
MIFKALLILIEVLIITVLNYYMASSFYSLDVLYCLPVIQTARFAALQTETFTRSYTISLVAMTCAIAWSAAEAAVVWPSFPLGALAMNILTRGVTFTIIARVIAKLWKEKELERNDNLTGLANRVELTRKLEEVQLHSERSGKPYSLLLINIDKFREFNDEFGHQYGDEVLKLLAAVLQEKTKAQDMVARLASDEFVILLPDTEAKLCLPLGTRICSSVVHKFSQNNWDLNLSFGQVTEIGGNKNLDNLYKIAGENLTINRNRKNDASISS